MTLPEHLTICEPDLAGAILAMAEAVKKITSKIRTANTEKAGSINTFNEEQLHLDVLADKIIFAELQASEAVGVASSEEQVKEVKLNDRARLAVAFDPLDGSSLVDVNLAVGTVFGIWDSHTFIGQKGKDLMVAGYAVYGPRTTFVFTAGSEPSKFTLQEDGTWLRTKTKLTIGEGKMFAPGNLRACLERPDYKKLVDYWINEKYTLRYSGGMVPDVNQIIIKGKGVFSYPPAPSAPAKLRLLYECAPLAKVIEAAGGASSDGKQSILEKTITTLDERTEVCLGSKEEVKRYESYLKS